MSRYENRKQRLISEVIFQMPLLTEDELQELADLAVLFGRRHAFRDAREPGAVIHKPKENQT